jgi:hypothetical protein
MRAFFTLLALTICGAGCASSKQPKHMMIEQAYFKCNSSRSLQGGIYGKGPLAKFGPTPSSCSSSEWVRITRSEFKSLATEWYGKDWSQETTAFWKYPYWDCFLTRDPCQNGCCAPQAR